MSGVAGDRDGSSALAAGGHALLLAPAGRADLAIDARTGPGSDDGVGDLTVTVGRNLRRLRIRRGHSLERLARISGVSRAMLGQIETAKSVPTIGLLWKVANALDVPLANFLEASAGRGTTVIRVETARVVTASAGRFTLRALFPVEERRRVEFWELRIAARHEEVLEPLGVGATENLTLTSGRIEVEVGREAIRTLRTGDSIVYEADARRVLRNPASVELVAHLVRIHGEPVDL